MTQIGDRVLELHQQGVRSTDIAHRLDVAQSTVRYHLRKAGTRAVPTPRDDVVEADPGASSRVATRELVAGMIADGLTRAEIARRLGISKGTVSYHARRLGEQIDDRCRRRYDWARVQDFYDAGNTVRQCMSAFGFSSAAWHDAVKRGAVVARPSAMPLDELLVPDTYRGREYVKRRLLTAGLKSSRCEGCGIESWLGKPISLALHHVNGLRNDNRLENLQLVCPNCHSQTDTFAGRNGSRRSETAG